MPKPLNCPLIAGILPKLLSYDPITGHLYWNRREGNSRSVNVFNGRSAGKRAGAVAKNDRYRKIGMNINGRKYLMLEHRIAWLIHHGSWPINDIDHINHNCQDNRIENLRDVEKRTNSMNMKLSSRNKSGFTGVYWHQAMNAWRASYRRIVVGYYKDKGDAAAAVKKARDAAGFHGNHGSERPAEMVEAAR